MRLRRFSLLAAAGFVPQVSALRLGRLGGALAREPGTSETATHSMEGQIVRQARLAVCKGVAYGYLVEDTGVTGQEKQVEVPIENAGTASAPFNEEDTAMLKSQDEEPDRQINVVGSKVKPDPLGRKIASLPLNAMKAGYDYAFGKGLIKR